MHFYSTLALFYIEPAATCLNSGTFSVRYADGSFTASGSFSSAGPFGEMGTERNGTFAKDEEGEDDDGASAPPPTRQFGDYRVPRHSPVIGGKLQIELPTSPKRGSYLPSIGHSVN